MNYMSLFGKIFSLAKRVSVLFLTVLLVFPWFAVVVDAQSVPVDVQSSVLEDDFMTLNEFRVPQNNSSVVSNTSSIVQMLGEIMAPIYQLATPGSNLTYDIYRYLMKHTESELGIDKDFFRRMQRKQAAPTVDIVFAPTNPKEGEKVTAFAIPRNFRTSKEKMYFTWYIVHDALDDNSKPDVEAGKKEAMRIVAGGNYDKDLFGEPVTDDANRDAYDASYGGDDGRGAKNKDKECDDSCQWVEGMTMFGGEITSGYFDDQGLLLYATGEEYEEAKMDRGDLSASMGKGVVNSEFITRCYRHNFGGQKGQAQYFSGRDLVIDCKHAFPEDIGDYDYINEDDYGTNPESPDTDGDGVVDEADLAGLGQDEFTWTYRKGDKVSVVVEGVSNIPINEGATIRLRYKNKHYEGDGWDVSPTASPEEWYKMKRDECETAKNDCLASTGNSLVYVPVGDRLPADKDCIATYSDCMKDLWEHQLQMEPDAIPFGEMSGYYKIMWAAPGICTEKKINEAENDWCDGDGDIGFQYLQLYDPVEQGKKLLEVSVNITPKNPQFSKGEDGKPYSDSTDLIIASADVVSDDNVNPDYLYYKWSVWRCSPDDFDKCEDVTEAVEFKSRKEGVGLREVGFYPLEGLFAGNTALLKVGVVVKRHINSVMSSPGVNGSYTQQIFSEEKKENFNSIHEYPNKYAFTAKQLVKVVKHDLKIELYSTDLQGGDEIVLKEKICEEGLYKKICPVYPFQVIQAKLVGEGLTGSESVIWKLNGKVFNPFATQPWYSDATTMDMIFPIIGEDNFVGRITAIVSREGDGGPDGYWEGDQIIEERLFSVHKPIVVIENDTTPLRESSRRIQRSDNADRVAGKDLWLMITREGEDDKYIAEADVRMSLVPTYLNSMVGKGGDSTGDLVVSAFIDGKYRQPILPDGAKLLLDNLTIVDQDEITKHSFDIKIFKKFNSDYRRVFKQWFGVTPPNELVSNVLRMQLQPMTIGDYQQKTGVVTTEKKTSLLNKVRNKFYASTVQNAPLYLIFLIRLAVSFVLVGIVMIVLMRGDDYLWNDE